MFYKGYVVFSHLVVVVIVAFLLVKKQRRAADQKNIMNYEKEDYDIRENIVDYDEDGAGKRILIII